MPGILIDLAREMDAEPHVVRVHLKSKGEANTVEYFGHDELERALKQGGDYWHRRLLGGRTAKDYFRLVGRLSKLQVRVNHEPPRQWPKLEMGDSPDEIVRKQEDQRDFPGWVSLGLSVDTLDSQLAARTVSISSLVSSTSESDEYDIFTCTCGCPECAGIWRGVETVHEDGLVVWRIRGIRPRRVVVFDREQYRAEVLSKVREALTLHKQMGLKAILGASDQPKGVEEALYYAEEAAPLA